MDSSAVTSEPGPKKAGKKKKRVSSKTEAAAAAAAAVDNSKGNTKKKQKKDTTVNADVAAANAAAAAAVEQAVASAVLQAVATDPVVPATSSATTSAATTKKKKTNDPKSTATSTVPFAAASVPPIDWNQQPLLDQVLYRLTEGIPRMELKAMAKEADECEQELLQEIQLLEEALAAEQQQQSATTSSTNAKSTDPSSSQTATKTGAVTLTDDKKKQVDALIDNQLTPLDRCFTFSALVGRLRDDLALPSLRTPPAAALLAKQSANSKKKRGASPAPTYPQLVALAHHPQYTRVHPDPPTQLLAVWRKISSHRTAMVFKKPVKPEEAPGYAERILFPMDLSLIRKMIVARMITSYSQLHQRIRLISHNCVKYNGRESDYGIVAREFEATVDEYILAAVHQPTPGPGTAAAAAGPTSKTAPKNAGGSGRSSPKDMVVQAPSVAAASAAAVAAAVVAGTTPTNNNDGPSAESK